MLHSRYQSFSIQLLFPEATLLSRLNHPNLVKFIGLYNSSGQGLHDSTTYIVSAWMDKGDLEHCMESMARGKQPIPRIRWVRFYP